MNNQAQAFFAFWNEALNPFKRPAVMSFNPWREVKRRHKVAAVFYADLFSGEWGHNAGHSGKAGLSKWLEWHYPLSAGQ